MAALVALVQLLATPLAMAWASPDFDTRHTATQWANRNPAAVVLALALVDEADPEVQMRAECVLRSHRWPEKPLLTFASVLVLFHPDESEVLLDGPMLMRWGKDGRLGEIRRTAVRLGLIDAEQWLAFDAAPTFWQTRTDLIQDGIRRLRLVSLPPPNPQPQEEEHGP